MSFNSVGDLDATISVALADGVQTVYAILASAGYNGSPIASQLIIKNPAGADIRYGRNEDVDATNGLTLTAPESVTLERVDLNMMRIYVSADTDLEFSVHGSN